MLLKKTSPAMTEQRTEEEVKRRSGLRGEAPGPDCTDETVAQSEI